MANLSELYEYNNAETGDMANGRPQWFKLWADKYADALDIENLDNDLTKTQKDKLFMDVGRAFINALFYHIQHDEERYDYYKPLTRDGRIIWNALKRDIDQSYRDYELRVINGAKGGRPPKST